MPIEFSFPHIPLGFMQTCASEVMAGSLITYVRGAQLRGLLFQPNSTGSGLISGVHTNFFVNNKDPLRALA
ncbi:hypothetical protein B0T25DRAFT_449949 [Lasiosphaeria hispida]|uniref:Uncharacterized protein n=1 Tax=Lasiosphaeria hispida TaxID=260671 RepID=A0AAJ0MGQ7_9PEZI|nr:hypothetical protein B0T25DRAFT_449949 [Lasiosphaeria hispida]